MANGMTTSRAGLELVKSFEGFREHAVSLGDDRWMIGYGHTNKARENLRISRADAELILRKYDLPKAEKTLKELVLAPLSQNEFDALVSFIFSIGENAFKSSAVLGHLNGGERLVAAEAMASWRKGRVNGKLVLVDALVRRRAAERALFLEHPSGRISVPSALVRPELDIAAAMMTPRDTAVVIEPDYNSGAARVREKLVEEIQGEEDIETAPQAAARAVKERLTRILGENASAAEPAQPSSAAPGTIDGASVEEITKAISELADPADEPEPSHLKTVASNDAEDLTDAGEPAPLPFGEEGFERRRSPRITPPPYDEPLKLVDPVLQPRAGTNASPVHGLRPVEADAVVDDLETYQPTPEEIAAATAAHDEFEQAEKRSGFMNWLPFAIVSLAGLVGVIWGAQDFVQLASNDTAITNASDKYFGPFAILTGSILFVIGAYYLIRAFKD